VPRNTSSKPTSHRTLRSQKDLLEGTTWLAEQEPRFAYALSRIDPPQLRERPDGFVALLKSIVSQQVSTAAASAILGRLEGANLMTESAILSTDLETLRTYGVSRQKAGYLHAIAEAGVDYVALRRASTEEVVEILVNLKGVGVWTAEIYAMFALGRADAFAAGDLGLQQGARLLFDLPEKPTERELRERAEAWSPWRAVAARILWSYYDNAKSTRA